MSVSTFDYFLLVRYRCQLVVKCTKQFISCCLTILNHYSMDTTSPISLLVRLDCKIAKVDLKSLYHSLWLRGRCYASYRCMDQSIEDRREILNRSMIVALNNIVNGSLFRSVLRDEAQERYVYCCCLFVANFYT